jgi:hypothetical protein
MTPERHAAGRRYEQQVGATGSGAEPAAAAGAFARRAARLPLRGAGDARDRQAADRDARVRPPTQGRHYFSACLPHDRNDRHCSRPLPAGSQPKRRAARPEGAAARGIQLPQHRADCGYPQRQGNGAALRSLSSDAAGPGLVTASTAGAVAPANTGSASDATEGARRRDSRLAQLANAPLVQIDRGRQRRDRPRHSVLLGHREDGSLGLGGEPAGG